jgi:hypothetical protein
MPRPKSERNSTDLDVEIARLEQERKRLIQSEDQRRGSIVRECLASLNGDQLREVLRPFVNSRDAFLFDLESVPTSSERSSKSVPARARGRTSQPNAPRSVEALQTNAAD